MKTLDKLIHMANQIAIAFRTQEHDKAVEATWDHLWHFWDPRMREMIVEHWRSGGEGLNPIAAEGVARLAKGLAPDPQSKATEFSQARDPDLLSDAG
jgi:formate dehydrogenase subunit delta